MVRGTKVRAILLTSQLTSAEESQIDRDIDKFLRRDRRIFAGKEAESEFQLFTPAVSLSITFGQLSDEIVCRNCWPAFCRRRHTSLGLGSSLGLCARFRPIRP